MGISSYKVTDSDYMGKDVVSLETRPQMSAAALQAAFDRLVKEVIVPKLNALIDALAGTGGADEIGKRVAGMSGANVGSLLAELNTAKAPVASPAFTGVPTAPTPETLTNTAQVATTAFVQAVLAQAIFDTGAADMLRSVYDPNLKATDVFAYADAAAKPAELPVELAANAWTEQSDGSYRQSVSVAGLAASGYSYIVSPEPDSFAEYGGNGVYMDEVTAANTAVFYAQTNPQQPLNVHILKL